MSKIKMFALGGLNENGKNMFVIEVDDDILVIEAGLKHSDEHTLGIDYMIPNIEYLKQNKKKIRGIFLTHAHDENSGALTDIINDLDNIPIYGSKFTIDIIKKEFETDKLKTSNLITIKANKTLEVGNLKVFPVNQSHSIPDNYGYAIYTKDGVIFYSADFVFDPMMRGAYQTDIGKLAYIGKQGVLCLLTESIYADKKGFTTPHHRINSVIRETLNKAEGRIIFNVLNSHLYRIQELFNEVSKTDRKIVIMGKRLQNTVTEAIANKYLFVKPGLIGDLSNINDPDVVIVNSNEREKPYSNMLKIINGYDKYVKISDKDTVFLATPIYEGREKTYFHMLDELARLKCDVVTLPSKTYLSHHASSEDLMMMIDLIRPKYYFPIRGEYHLQVANAEVASKLGIRKDNIILKENGDVVTFKDGVLQDDYEKVPSGSIQIDGESSDDVGELVLKDRELLSNDGIIIITATISKKDKKLIGGPEILTRGFVYVKDSSELIKEIKNKCTKIITDNIHSNYVEYNKIKSTIRDELSKYLSVETGNKPMIITVTTEV